MKIENFEVVDGVLDLFKCERLTMYVDYVQVTGYARFKFQQGSDASNWTKEELETNIDNGTALLRFEIEADTERKAKGLSILLGASDNLAEKGMGVASAEDVINLLDNIQSISLLGTEKAFIEMVYETGYEEEDEIPFSDNDIDCDDLK